MKSKKVLKRMDRPDRSPGRQKASAGKIVKANKGENSAQDKSGGSIKRIRSPRNDSEPALREAKDHLELRMRERTAELEQANRSLQEEIADRKRAEEAVYRTKEEWERTFDTVPDLMAILDDQHRIVRVNRAMADRLGVSPDQCRGLRCYEVIHHRPDVPGLCPHALTCHDGLQHVAEVHEPGLGGDFLVSTTPLCDGQGRLIGSVHIARDITQRKRAEEQVTRQNALLEGINGILQEALSSGTYEELGRACLTVAEKITGSQFGFVGEIGPDGLLHDIAMSDSGWERCRLVDKTARRKPIGSFKIHGLYGRVLQDGKSLLTNTPAEHPDSIGTPDGHPPLNAFLGAPLIREGRTVGILALGNREGGYREMDREALEVLAPVVAEAFARKRAEETVREVNERFRVAITGSPVTVHQHDTELRLTWVYNPPLGFSVEDFVGKKVEEVYGPEDGARLAKLKHQVLETGVGMRGETWFTLRGRRYFVDYSMEPMRDGTGQITGVTCAIIDMTERKEAEKALRDSEARFRLLSETASRLLATSDPQGIVEDLCRDVMTHLDCEVFFNFLVDAESGKLHLNACAGIPEGEAGKIEWLGFGTAACGCTARDRTPVIAEDIRHVADPRAEIVKSYGIQAYVCHPLRVQERLIGTLTFGTKNRTHFSLEEIGLVRTVTDQVATAMDRMRLIEELQRSRNDLEKRVQERTGELGQVNEALRQLSLRILTAQEEERKRVAGDIHDGLGSLLSQVKFMIEDAIQKEGERAADPDVTDPLKSTLLLVQESVNECRRLQMDLRPPMLDDLGILATLSWFCRRFGTTYPGIRIEQKIDIEEAKVPASFRTSIFRIAQESMNNIVKHSKADEVTLALRGDGSRIELTVQDNGIGFDADDLLSRGRWRRGLGLQSMRERVELSGGTFRIESASGKGTLIRASWPC